MNRYAMTLIASLFLLAGCSGRQAVVVADPVTGPGPAAAPTTEEASSSQDAPAVASETAAGTQLLNEACTLCHDLSPIEGLESAYSADEWREVIDRMVSYGAAVTPAQTDQLVAYMISQGAAP